MGYAVGNRAIAYAERPPTGASKFTNVLQARRRSARAPHATGPPVSADGAPNFLAAHATRPRPATHDHWHSIAGRQRKAPPPPRSRSINGWHIPLAPPTPRRHALLLLFSFFLTHMLTPGRPNPPF